MPRARRPPRAHDQRDMSEKQFTLAQATATLPLVRHIVGDIMAQYVRWQELVREFEGAAANSRADMPDPRAEQLQRQAQSLAADIESFVAELAALGVQFKGYDLGLVDFPSEIDGRPVLLCWRFGEPSIAFYHDAESGYAGRRPLPSAALSR